MKVPEDTESIIFPITGPKNDEFMFTNDSLNFSKEIKYWRKHIFQKGFTEMSKSDLNLLAIDNTNKK